MPIVSTDDHPARARDAAADVRNTEAALPVFDGLSTLRPYFRVDQDHLRKSFGLVLVFFSIARRGKTRHEHPETFVDLRRGEADALVLVHGLEHVVDELLKSRRAYLRRVDRTRTGAQDRVPH